VLIKQEEELFEVFGLISEWIPSKKQENRKCVRHILNNVIPKIITIFSTLFTKNQFSTSKETNLKFFQKSLLIIEVCIFFPHNAKCIGKT